MAARPRSNDPDWRCFVEWERNRVPLIHLAGEAPTALQQLANEWSRIPNKKPIIDAVKKIQQCLKNERNARIVVDARRQSLQNTNTRSLRLIKLSRDRIRQALQTLLESRERLVQAVEGLQQAQGQVAHPRSQESTRGLLNATRMKIDEVRKELSTFDSSGGSRKSGTKRGRDDNDDEEDDDSHGPDNQKRRTSPDDPESGSRQHTGGTNATQRSGAYNSSRGGRPSRRPGRQTDGDKTPSKSDRSSHFSPTTPTDRPRTPHPRSGSSSVRGYTPRSEPRAGTRKKTDSLPDYEDENSAQAGGSLPLPGGQHQPPAPANENGDEEDEEEGNDNDNRNQKSSSGLFVSEDDSQEEEAVDAAADDEVANGDVANDVDGMIEQDIQTNLRDRDAAPACVVQYTRLFYDFDNDEQKDEATKLFRDLVKAKGMGDSWGAAPLLRDVLLHKADIVGTWVRDTREELETAFREMWDEVISQHNKSDASGNAKAMVRDWRVEAQKHYKDHHELIFPTRLKNSEDLYDFYNNLREKMDNEKKESLIRSWNRAIARARFNRQKALVRRLKTDLEENRKRWDNSENVWRPGEEKPDAEKDLLPMPSAQNVGFDNARSAIDGEWKYVKEIGSGGYGTATVWRQFDADGNPVDRIVIKQCFPRDRWDVEGIWYGELAGRLPNEYMFNKTLNDCEESDNVVEVRSYATYELHRMYRIYMEFCQHGTLNGLVDEYRKAPKDDDDQETDDETSIGGRIPTRVLWSIFEGLCSAVCLMHHGHLPDLEKRNHEPLMHRDIKTENIFLSAPHPTQWSMIPVIKLGDFGIAVEEGTDESTRRGIGTKDWMAPEVDLDDEDTYPNSPSTKSDMWAVGRVILALMNLETSKDVRAGVNRDKRGRPTFSDAAMHAYPKALRDHVNHCLQFEPADRPSAIELWTKIHGHVAALPGLRGTPAEILKLQSAPENELLRYPEDGAPLVSVGDQVGDLY